MNNAYCIIISNNTLYFLRKETKPMKKKLWALFLAVAMIAAFTTGCGGNNGGNDANADADTTASYTFAANIWSMGPYPLAIMIEADQLCASATGMTIDVADNNFTADKIVTDLQTQLAKKPDGVIMFSVVDSVFGKVQEACDSAGVPYVLDTNFPSDKATWEAIQADELYVGGVAASPYNMGKECAEQVKDPKGKTALILGAAIGDYSHDQRILGFTETFEAAGGKVLQVEHCDDPTSAVTKAKNLFTNYDADVVYCSGGDYLSAAAGFKKDNNKTWDLYGTDVAPDLIADIEAGVIQAMNGGNHVNGSIAECLLINYLDGHPILNEDGSKPFLDYLQAYLITPDNAAGFAKLYENANVFITDEMYQSLLYRYNPDVSLKTYDEFLKGYADAVYKMAEEA